MPDPILLHIGTHKTGTSSVQQFAATHELPAGLQAWVGLDGAAAVELGLLAIREGFDYPARMRWAKERCCQQTARHQVMTQRVRRGPLFASHESLSYIRTVGEVERLCDLLAPREVHAVLVLRDPTEFLASYENELRRSGFTLSDDPTSFAYVKPDSWLVDYDTLVGVYREVLGDRLYVVDYAEALAEHGSVIPAVFAPFGEVEGWEGIWANAR